MNNYTTVRVDSETMKKLECIVETLQKDNIGKVSKAAVIRHMVDCELKKLNQENQNSSDSTLVD